MLESVRVERVVENSDVGVLAWKVDILEEYE